MTNEITIGERICRFEEAIEDWVRGMEWFDIEGQECSEQPDASDFGLEYRLV